MKFKKILAVMLSSLLIIAYMPMYSVRASSEYKLNVPSFVTQSGYSYEDSQILWSMRGNKNTSFDFISRLGYVPLDLTWEEFKNTNGCTRAMASIVHDGNRADPEQLERDFFDTFDIYYTCHLFGSNGLPEDYRSGTCPSVELNYRFYIVPKMQARVALYNDAETRNFFVYATEGMDDSVYVVSFHYQYISGSSSPGYEIRRGENFSNQFLFSNFSSKTGKISTSYPLKSGFYDVNSAFISTNIAMFDCEEDAILYANEGIDNSINGTGNNLGCDSFGWDSFSMVPMGDRFEYQYTYSDDYMLAHPEMCVVLVDYLSVFKYIDELGVYSGKTVSSTNTFDLSDYPSRYNGQALYVKTSTYGSNLLRIFYAVVDTVTMNSEIFSNYEIQSYKVYITVTLRKSWLDRNSNMKILMQTSSDVRTFCYDVLTGELVQDSSNVIVKSKSRYDDDGNEIDRVVTDIVVNDNSNNTTIGHYEVNDEDQTITNKETNVTVDALNGNEVHAGSDNDVDISPGGGSGGTGGSFPGNITVTVNDGDPPLVVEDDDFKLMDVWKYMKSGFGFLDDPDTPEPNDGVLVQLLPIFAWLPPEFTNLLVGGLSSVIIVSIIRIARK